MDKKLTIAIIIILFSGLMNYNMPSNKIKKRISRAKIGYNYIEKKEKPIGNIIIPKIKVNNDLYDIKSPNNDVDKNVALLYKNNHIIVLAAHSGTGKAAYFKNLNQLNINDEIIINLDNNKNKYIVKNIWEEEKNGTINFKEEYDNQLVLTTCSPTNKKKQLIVSCIIKEHIF